MITIKAKVELVVGAVRQDIAVYDYSCRREEGEEVGVIVPPGNHCVTHPGWFDIVLGGAC